MTTKRIADVAVSVLLLLLLSPFILIISLAIAVTMGTPVVFRQRRPGWYGKPFNMLKFRTMANAVDADGQLLSDSERTTPLGRFLRDTSLDELPQLVNVLLGEMSLVGPRPLMKQYVENCTPAQLRRFEARPGITGWAQIHGRKALDYDKRFEFDIWYVDHRSLLFDLRILFLTPSTVIRQDGIVETGEVSFEPATVYPSPARLPRLPAAGSRLGLQVETSESLCSADPVGLCPSRFTSAENLD